MVLGLGDSRRQRAEPADQQERARSYSGLIRSESEWFHGDLSLAVS
jgi:hypothetical protein